MHGRSVTVSAATMVACGLMSALALASCSDDRTPGAVEPADTAETVPAETVPAKTVPAETSVAVTEPVVDDGRTVVGFDDAGSVAGWSNVDDTVMGGVSASATTWEEGQLVFAGDLSLENNGGFASVRSPEDPAIGTAIGAATSVVIDAEGDGRTYVLQLRTTDELLYIARFATVDGVQQPYVLPLAEFEPVTRFLEPSPDAPPLDASAVVQLAIYLLDAQEGSFRLAVSAIAAQ